MTSRRDSKNTSIENVDIQGNVKGRKCGNIAVAHII